MSDNRPLAIFPRKVDFSCFGYHPDLKSRLMFQEKWVLGQYVFMFGPDEENSKTRLNCGRPIEAATRVGIRMLARIAVMRVLKDRYAPLAQIGWHPLDLLHVVVRN